MPKIMAKNESRCHKDIWAMIENGSIKSNIK